MPAAPPPPHGSAPSPAPLSTPPQPSHSISRKAPPNPENMSCGREAEIDSADNYKKNQAGAAEAPTPSQACARGLAADGGHLIFLQRLLELHLLRHPACSNRQITGSSLSGRADKTKFHKTWVPQPPNAKFDSDPPIHRTTEAAKAVLNQDEYSCQVSNHWLSLGRQKSNAQTACIRSDLSESV